jgi:hypothetical protein
LPVVTTTLSPASGVAVTSLGAQVADATSPLAAPPPSLALQLDVSGCQVDAVLASSNSGAGLLVADFVTDAGSALLHGNRIRSRFPMGGAAVLAGVAQAAITGNVVANEVAPQVPLASASPVAQLPSYSLVLNPATTEFGGALDPSGAQFGDVAGVNAVAVTGNVFIDPTSLPPRPAAIPAALADWDVLNTVISYGLAGPPAVTGLSPANGPVGAQVIVNGHAFTGATSVTFGGVAAAFSPSSSNPDGQLIAAVPPGSGAVDVVVTTPAGTSPIVPQDQFTYLAVTGVSPASGQPPLQVTIFGSGFTGATQVSFGSVPASGLVVSPQGDQIQVSLPPGQGSVPVTVTTPSGTSASGITSTFSYLTVFTIIPSVSGFAPSPSVSVLGLGFTPDSVVIFTSVTSGAQLVGANVVFSGSASLSVQFPGQTSGSGFGSVWRVTVRTPYGTSAPCPVTFTFSGTFHS